MEIDKEISIMLNSTNGIVFKAVVVEHTPIWPRIPPPGKYEIKIYDTRDTHTEHGQFVTSYYAATIATIVDEATEFVFDYGVPDWRLTGPAVQQLIGLARAFT